jgi:hypothetical protein
MQLRINYNNILFRREVKQIINRAFSGQLYEIITITCFILVN